MTTYKHSVLIEWNENENGIDLHQVVDIDGATHQGLLMAFMTAYEDILTDGVAKEGEEETNGNTNTD